MFIGHIPAGFLWTRLLRKSSKTVANSGTTTRVLLIGMFSGIIPDLDLLYFYLIDHRMTAHHNYWTHVPLIWMVIFSAWLVAAYLSRKPVFIGVGLVMGSNILMHMVLDTVAGGIRWFYPFSETDFVMANVPAVHGWWVWNFVLHWTFLFEIVLAVAAMYVWLGGGIRFKNRTVAAGNMEPSEETGR